MGRSEARAAAAADGDVYILVDQYLNQLPGEESGVEPAPWVSYLKTNISHFRGTRFRPSKLRKEYAIQAKVLEVQPEVPQWGVITSECKSFGELNKKLSEAPQACVQAQLIFFALNEDLPGQHFGKVAVREETRKLKATSVMLLCLIGAKWGIEPSQLPCLGAFGEQVPQSESTQISLPSQDHPTSGVSRFQSTRSMEVTSLAPPYDSDLTQYIKQSHCSSPRCESVTFYYGGQHRNYWRGIVVCSTQTVMKDLVRKSSSVEDCLPSGTRAVASDPRVVTRHVLEYVATLAAQNLSNIANRLDKMKYEARQSPSYGKINYTLHLEDHLSLLSQLFDPLQHVPEEWPKLNNNAPDERQLERLRADYQYVSTTAKKLLVEATELRGMIRLHVEGKSSSRTTLFTVIAAIYLPLNLATGIFGMNIEEITGIPLSPKWQDVIYLGLPLVGVSVAVPLLADRVYRKIQDFAGHRPKAFSGLLYVGVPAVVVLIILIVVILGVQGKL